MRCARRSGGTTRIARPSWALLVPILSCCLACEVGCRPDPASRFHFVESSVDAGIRFQHTDGSSGKYFIVETLASGVGLFDYDGDGDLDIYFLNGSGLPPVAANPQETSSALYRDALYRNALYRNDGDATFTEVTRQAGVEGVGFSVGCCVGDYDGDGDLDLYVAGYGSNVLYRNNGKASGHTFTDVTAEARVDDSRFSAGCAFVDIDGDDDLDLYVSNYCEVDFETSTPCIHNGVPSYCAPARYKPVTDSLFLNLGNATFEDISDSSGITRTAKWGMGVLTTDHNGDGKVDIYVANDVSDNFLFENLDGLHFKNVALQAGVAMSSHGDEQGSMGVDAGDFNRDGRFDFLVTNYQKQLNALYVGDGALYSDLAMGQGLGNDCLPLVSWGTGFFDFDNDGWLDLFIANGHLEDRIDEYDESSTYRQKNQLFRNVEGKFREIGSDAGPALAENMSSRGAAFGDIDNDGDVDIVICNSRERPSLLINESHSGRSWVQLELRGKKNVFAIGARVVLVAEGNRHVREVRSGSSYVSQNDLRLHFGLGDATRVDRVEVRWPGGTTSHVENLEVRKLHVLREE